ncbi:Uncharacterised protein [Klebsiella pneumoniae]|nr:Uncharacterised protein [Klebsiella pneumoniae]
MSKLEYTDNLMLSRQLPLKSVALNPRRRTWHTIKRPDHYSRKTCGAFRR